MKILPKLPSESIDLIVTSPPCNIEDSSGNELNNGRDRHDDETPHDEYADWQRDCLNAMLRVLRDDGAIFYHLKWRVQNGLLQDRHNIINGFPVRQIIIWKHACGTSFNPDHFLQNYEMIYLIAKTNFRLDQKATSIGAVWEIPQKTNKPHPASFPLELAQRCIRYTNARIVLDPFIGDGTTAIAANTCGRQWIGIKQKTP